MRYISARIRATDAKAARDKEGQRAAGAAIRELKKARLAPRETGCRADAP